MSGKLYWVRITVLPPELVSPILEEALFILELFIPRKHLMMPAPPPCLYSFSNLSPVGGGRWGRDEHF